MPASSHPLRGGHFVGEGTTFNSISRESILHETLAHLPGVVDLVFGCYGGQTPLLWLSDSDFIESLRGVQQGDPLGPALFALAFHSVLLRVKESHPDVRVMAGHDDVFMVGRPEDCVQRMAPSLGRRPSWACPWTPRSRGPTAGRRARLGSKARCTRGSPSRYQTPRGWSCSGHR